MLELEPGVPGSPVPQQLKVPLVVMAHDELNPEEIPVTPLSPPTIEGVTVLTVSYTHLDVYKRQVVGLNRYNYGEPPLEICRKVVFATLS